MERMKTIETWSYVEHVLESGVLAEQGKMAVVNLTTGELTIGQTGATFRAIGYFDDTMTGDGIATARVKLFREVHLHWWVNDSATPVLAADFMNPCYILDDQTVSGDATDRAVAGRVWAVSNTLGVLVEMDGFGAG